MLRRLNGSRSRRLYEHTGRNRRRASVRLEDNDGRQMRDVWRNHTGGKNGVSGMRRKSIDQKRRTDNESKNNQRNRVHMGADRGDPGSR